MMAEKEESQNQSQSSAYSWSLESGGYLGEISALCFVHVPLHLSSFPLLLVGSGSEILLYDVELGVLLNSFHVFEGIRVHGISSGTLDVTHNGMFSTLTSAVVVFGEKRVKLYSLIFQLPLGSKNKSKVCAELLLNRILPRFSHWVMDVLFLKEDHRPSKFEVNNYLAVGLGDNSVCLWDISKSTMAIKVRCPERTLLYSMRLWGTSIDSLKVASGTIYNEVIVWKLDSERHNSSLTMENSNNYHSLLNTNSQLHDSKYEATYLNRLVGHEGSIFRLAWFPDGSKLMSVSDDRSARIWKIEAVKNDSNNSEIVNGSDSASLILFGHTARVWDCYISDSLIVTAGEDCTCRVWGMDGKQLLLKKEHTGRGIWRCTYDPSSSLLITAGFDSSVKVHRLHASLSGDTIEQDKVVMEGFKERMEFFTLIVPNLSEQVEPLTSKSEYVRCLHFSQEDTLYVATNNGYLHHVKLSGVADVKWAELVHISEDAPIVCMDLLSRKASNPSKSLEDWVAVGDGKGNVTIVRVVGSCTPTVEFALTWLAETERQLLGTYWCKSLGPSYIFTADPKGTLKLWKIHGHIQSGFEQSSGSFEALLTVLFTSCFGTRIMCLDALLDEQVLVCGDQRGNLSTFSLSKGLLDTLVVSETKSSPISSFKGAHGISSVTSISVSKTNFNQVGIESTGGDGCICSFKYNGDWRSLEFTGMKQMKELSLVQSVSSDANSDDDLACGSYAVGFASADFIVWNLQNETKVVQVSCGGWRRPHSYYLGDVPESQNCFAFVKDHAIHIHRLWVPAGDKKLISHVLHMQHHGREIHSLCFVSDVIQSSSDENRHSVDRCSCIATGCEDGTVRLTRYAPDGQNWFASKLLGEHVGGSAVRSICFVSKMYKTAVDKIYKFDSKYECNSALDETEIPSLLISVGAKRVLTSWLLRKRKLSNSRKLGCGDIRGSENNFNQSQRASTSMSFQWLSTDMPSKFSSTRKTMENREKPIVQGKNATNVMDGPASETHVAETNKLESKSLPVDKNGDDWRYLAVTAFLVRGADSRSIVCFIVVSCSDATLALRALILPYRLWFDVALLGPHRSPVLSLQNVILPIASCSQDSLQIGGVYTLISGSTDGSITFWDLTKCVEGFMQRMSQIQPESFIKCQIRPRTGRGSQGGRWWRTLDSQYSKTNPEGLVGTIDGENLSHGHKNNPTTLGASSNMTTTIVNSKVTCSQSMDRDSLPCSEELTDDLLVEQCEIRPFHVLNNVHQSGVNCLHVSTITSYKNSESVSTYCVISGGDDQALHCLTFELSLQEADDGFKNGNHSGNANNVTDLHNAIDLSADSKNQRCRIRFLFHDRIASAHSSALKGVWTDGTWAFTIGLDQRVRCWYLEEQGKLSEHAHLIVSVTEPETLDARSCGRNQYQIAVAGRGMQIVKFSASGDKDGRG
ncbi:hypothetical protein AQUCO_02900069v1 [Aquilegia coerulea]|uniref:Uncharacterized protein n=1 Tax=Aquilegia coerulea TaxID=218851 RepID=A0A2G5D369_AQUCA|nr:hypothetical protein AQUCO_02900069v1 [Aquilegia coerulea]